MRLELICGCSRPHTIFKAKADGPLIDRDRPAIRKLRLKLKSATKKFLKARAPDVIAQVLDARASTQKSEDRTVDKILAQLKFNEWAILSGDLDAQVGVSDAEITGLVNDRAVEYAKERGAELVTRISESTREMLRADVAQALEDGDSNEELAATLEDSYGFSADRAEVIARTETAYADVAGNLEAYRASGVVAEKKWITGEGCCDLCDELNGETIGIDEDFEFDGESVDGPPGHPNCRCDVVPILDTEVQDESAD